MANYMLMVFILGIMWGMLATIPIDLIIMDWDEWSKKRERERKKRRK